MRYSAALLEHFLNPRNAGLMREPDGVGAETGTFLRPGDRIEAELEHMGILSSKVVRP